jgi:hypothetical protein
MWRSQRLHPKILRAWKLGQAETSLHLLYAYICTRLTHFVDGHKGMIPVVRYQFFGKKEFSFLYSPPPPQLVCKASIFLSNRGSTRCWILKTLENFRLVLNEIYPSKLAEIINETHIIIVSSNRIGCWTPNTRKHLMVHSAD